MRLLLIVAVLAALVLLIWWLTSRNQPAEPRPRPIEQDPKALEDGGEGEPPKGPPSSGRADPLEMIRAALPSMSSAEIEHLLEMGATLKPGAEELFREELKRREQEGED